MHRLIILFAVSLLLLTGPTNAFDVQIKKEMVDEEYSQYVTRPCLEALIDKAGIREYINNGTVVTGL